MISRLMARLVAIGCALALAVVALPTSRAAAATTARPSDFNGDGYADLAIGAPASLMNGRTGEVNVLYGSRSGLTAAGDQVWSQATTGVQGTAEPYEEFGAVLASGDFDSDGHADLAIGVPGDTFGGIRAVGAVNVLYGSATGLTAAGDQRWSRVGLPPVSFGGAFGSALAAGDFDADGYVDLAIGARDDDPDPGPSSPTGVVVILRGSGSGLTATGVQVLRADQIATPDPLPIDVLRLGFSLVAGDFDGNGIADLAAGAPDSGDLALLPEIDRPGAVAVFYGSTDGLDTSSSELWHQDSPGIPGDDEANDQFATSLAAGDLDGDGDDDLVVGAPYSDGVEAGTVTVIEGSPDGLTSTDSQRWDQDVAGVPGVGEANDRFGAALAIGDFDGDDAEDLAVGMPGEQLASNACAGQVIVLRGSATGLNVTGVRAWTQDSPGVPGRVRACHLFGTALSALDFGRSGRPDLAVGVPGQGVDGHRWAGMVDVLYGSSTGLVGTKAQGWSQASPGVKGVPGNYELFGASLAH